jgi:hypothetical protein
LPNIKANKSKLNHDLSEATHPQRRIYAGHCYQPMVGHAPKPGIDAQAIETLRTYVAIVHQQGVAAFNVNMGEKRVSECLPTARHTDHLTKWRKAVQASPRDLLPIIRPQSREHFMDDQSGHHVFTIYTWSQGVAISLTTGKYDNNQRLHSFLVSRVTCAFCPSGR